jgi:hypothetical protein
MDFKVTSIKRRTAGETLSSLVVGVGLVSMCFSTLAALYLFSVHSFVSLGNYMDLDGGARLALDVMSADIRQANGITSYSSNALTLKTGTNQLTYTFDPGRRILYRQLGSLTRPLLTQCDAVQYDFFERNPTNGVYDYYPDAAAGVTNSKMVQVTVYCTASVMGRKENSTTMQSAKTVIRKQK